MPTIQQENGVKSVAGLPVRWGVRAYRELSAALRQEGADSERYKNLARLLDEVTAAPLPLDSTDAQLCMLAETYANDCASNAATIHEQAALRERMAFICRVRGLTPPDCKDDKQAILRCTDAAWWRRNLRKLHGRAFEAAAIRLGFVSIRAGAYASNETVARRRGQVERNKAALASVRMVNEHGTEYGLNELAAKGTSNKRIRRGELMLRLAGCEDVANEAGHVGVFITLTAPSKYHAVLQKSGAINPNYADANPRQVQTYLQKTWARIRAAYGRYSIKPYGFRIAEPHHDGCVHWHALVFMRPAEVGYFCAIVEAYALAEDGDEPGAQAQRVKFEMIDASKGSAAAYIAKYISKNIDDDDDNHDEVTDEAGNVVKLAVDKASARVDAWAGVWGVRQFQPIGQPPVTVWRELRRVAEREVKDAPANVRAAWDAAQRVEETDGDGVVTLVRAASFGNYIRAQGGACMGRDYAIGVAVEDLDIEGRYGLRIGPAPVGIYAKASPDAVYTSTRYTWTRKQAGVDLRRSWSPVNNCTPPHWAAGAMPGELVAEFDEVWFESEEYQKIFVPPGRAGEEWHAAEVEAAERRAATVWTEPSYAHRKDKKRGHVGTKTQRQ
jgi:hypothetical protein